DQICLPQLRRARDGPVQTSIRRFALEVDAFQFRGCSGNAANHLFSPLRQSTKSDMLVIRYLFLDKAAVLFYVKHRPRNQQRPVVWVDLIEGDVAGHFYVRASERN